MDNSLPTLGACALALALAGCAAPQPLPFQLVDPASKVHRGTLFPQTGRIEVVVDGQMYSGIYIVATGFAISHPMLWGPYFFPATVTPPLAFTSSTASRIPLSVDFPKVASEPVSEA